MPAIWSRATKRPQSSSWGKTIAGMNWTAWNSVRAKALTKRPRDIPSSTALLGMSLGLFVSAFARTEFQAVQFMPAIVFPQLLLCGLFVARDQMAGILQIVSDTMPLTYAFEALSSVTTTGTLGPRGTLDVSVIGGATLLLLALGAVTLRRRTP